jgi:uncharacterized protein (TIGR02145 family)
MKTPFKSILLLFFFTFGSCQKDDPAGSLPAAPSNLIVWTTTEQSIELYWTDNSLNETGFSIEEGDESSDFAPLVTVAANSTSYAHAGISLCKTKKYRVFAFNEKGSSTSPSNEVTRTGSGVADVDGNCYPTFQIGTQIWMVKNLKTSKYVNGNSIDEVADLATWSTLTTGAWSNYLNDASYENPYGKLYNWYAVNDPRKLCPAGWHVPTLSEVTLLTTFLGGESEAGGKLKEAGTTHWTDPNTGGTNTSGFTALPGGYRAYDVDFSHTGIAGYFWNAEAVDANNAWVHGMVYDATNLFTYGNGLKTDGFSVRCIKD